MGTKTSANKPARKTFIYPGDTTEQLRMYDIVRQKKKNAKIYV